MSGATGGGAGAVVRQGHLRKLKTMKKKFFVLRAETVDCSARLEYYESEKKFRAGATARRVLPLKSCYNITRRLDLKQKHVIALFTREEQFCVVAENEVDLHSWLTAILRQHRSEDASDELLHPIQHVWQVNVQKKGLGASKNIQGLYNLCLTDKTLALVKIKSHNNVISDLGIPERIEYTLKNIRRCGDSECFFYMEVGRQTVTGAGELWMHTDDSNIAQSMHSTIYLAMRNCTKECENEKDHVVMPKNEGSTLTARRQTYTFDEGKRPTLNASGLCVGSCMRQCVCAAADDSAAGFAPHAENQPPNNPLTDKIKRHHRTESLPTGCIFQEPLKISHGRTWSAPLTGDEVDRAIAEKAAAHSSCKAINGNDPSKKAQWSRRASTGTRMSKLSPAHSKNSGLSRNRCDSMPSQACSSYEVDRPAPRHNDLEDMCAGLDVSRDEIDAVGEWGRTPRIPEEPDCCDTAKDFISGGVFGRARTSSTGVSEGEEGYLAMAPGLEAALEAQGGRVSASSGSVCSGTPSTDPRFSEYQLEPATSHIGLADVRPPRAYSVGSRPAARPEPRHRAYSVGARHKPLGGRVAVGSAPLLPRASADDLMELDFSPPSSAAPSASPFAASSPAPAPRTAGYVEMRPGERRPVPTTPDGYVEMNYGRAATRPIAIAASRAPPPIPPAPPSPEPFKRRPREARTPLGSQTLFEMSLESPASPPDTEELDLVREEEVKRSPVACSPQYVTLVRPLSEPKLEDLPCNPTATKTIVRAVDAVESRVEPNTATLVVAGAGAAARFSLEDKRSPPPPPAAALPPPPPLNYAALDLEPRRASTATTSRTYTQIDFIRSEKLHAADGS